MPGQPRFPRPFVALKSFIVTCCWFKTMLIRISTPTKIDAAKEQPPNQYTGCCSNFCCMLNQHQKFTILLLIRRIYNRATMWRIKRSFKNMSLLEKEYAPLGRTSVDDSTKSEIDDGIELEEVHLRSRRWTQSLPFQVLPWILTVVFMITSFAQYELRDKSCQSKEYSLLRPTDFSAYLNAA